MSHYRKRKLIETIFKWRYDLAELPPSRDALLPLANRIPVIQQARRELEGVYEQLLPQLKKSQEEDDPALVTSALSRNAVGNILTAIDGYFRDQDTGAFPVCPTNSGKGGRH